MMRAQVLAVIHDARGPEPFSAARISASLLPPAANGDRGANVVEYDSQGRKTRAVLYARVERIETWWEWE